MTPDALIKGTNNQDEGDGSIREEGGKRRKW